ncbi:MAG: hypothetical protein LBU42_01135 [Prevotellaceae bacterium]|nr:hypothetical protein [Prevotellaceae bacterium]
MWERDEKDECPSGDEREAKPARRSIDIQIMMYELGDRRLLDKRTWTAF